MIFIIKTREDWGWFWGNLSMLPPGTTYLDMSRYDKETQENIVIKGQYYTIKDKETKKIPTL